jgi:maleate isomerase
MPDILGYRGKWGVLMPSTNTVVEPDYYAMAPHGVTLHGSRIYIADSRLGSNEQFEQLLEQVRVSINRAVIEVMTCAPDYLVMGMSAETFWGGRAGSLAFIERIEQLASVKISTGAQACEQAFAALGVRRIAVLTPYQPVADAQVRGFFEESGYDVVRQIGLKCPTAVSIAQADEARLRQALHELNGPDVEAIVQVGTNLSMLRLADEAERWLGKPVIAINAATMWHALRANGIMDQRPGFGALLRDY